MSKVLEGEKMKTDKLLESRVRVLEDQIFHMQRRIDTCMEQNTQTVEGLFKNVPLKNSTLDNQIECGVKTGHLFSVARIHTGVYLFRCVKCDLEYSKNNADLTTKEKRILTSVKGLKV